MKNKDHHKVQNAIGKTLKQCAKLIPPCMHAHERLLFWLSADTSINSAWLNWFYSFSL